VPNAAATNRTTPPTTTRTLHPNRLTDTSCCDHRQNPPKDHRDEVVASYVAHEVTPHVPDAWVDHTKTKVGYEVPFTRHFYTYVPPRPLEEIDADLDVLVKEIIGLLQEIEA